jgi:molybdate transport system substrate-binding protein
MTATASQDRKRGLMRPFIAATVALLAFGAAHPSSPSAAAQAKQPAAAAAAPLTVLSSNGFQAVMEDLAPRFEKAKHHKLAVTYDLAATLRQHIESGQPFDLAILTPAAIDDLIKSGKVAAGSRTPLARAGLGLAVRAGARKPDIATNEAFTRALRDAKSIAYVKEGASGVAFAALIKRLGMTDALQPKTRLTATRDEVGDALRNGSAELGVLPISEILPLAGVELAGAFPADMQTYIVMVAGVSAKTAQAAGVRQLIEFLTAPAALPVVTARGMERVPGTTASR